MAYEDFGTYTKVDGSSRLTVTTNKAAGIDVDQDIDCYLYKDFGASFFNSLDIEFEIYLHANTLLYGWAGMGLTVSVVDDRTQWNAYDVTLACSRGDGYNRMTLQRGHSVAQDNWDSMVGNTVYYCKLERAKASDTITCKIYSDSARTNLLDTLSVAGYGSGTRFRYLYGFINLNTAVGGRDWDGWIEKMERITAGQKFRVPAIIG